MHLSLDTNILLDIIGNRKPHVDAAIALLIKAKNENIRLSASSISWTTAYYILRKTTTNVKVRKALLELHRVIDILDTPGNSVLEALTFQQEADMEDGVQWRVAQYHEASAFISRDRRGFRHAEITVLSPEQWLAANP